MGSSIVWYFAVAGFVVALMLGAYAAVAVVVSGRRKVTREVWCRDRRRTAVVNFTERTRDGLTTRQVGQCSLLEHGETCGEGCRYLPFETAAEDADSATTTRIAV
jgi:hypothetical protein